MGRFSLAPEQPNVQVEQEEEEEHEHEHERAAYSYTLQRRPLVPSCSSHSLHNNHVIMEGGRLAAQQQQQQQPVNVIYYGYHPLPGAGPQHGRSHKWAFLYSGGGGCCGYCCWWTILAAAALLAHIVARYGPPAPPPSTTAAATTTFTTSNHETLPPSWQEFLAHEGTRLMQSVASLATVVPHVWHWCAFNIRQDVSELVDEIMWRTKLTMTAPPVCPRVVAAAETAVMGSSEHASSASSTNTRSSRHEQYTIVGQDRAMAVVRDAMDAWDYQQQQRQSSSSSASLFLLFIGTVGVGKLELALQLARNAYGECFDKALLVLDGRQEQHDNDDSTPLAHNSNYSFDLMSTNILLRIKRQQGNGLVVILRHAEALSARQLLHLLQLIQTQTHPVIFVAISGVGTRAVHESLKRYGRIDRIPQVELETTVREQVDDYFREDVAEYFQTIVPFVPIGQAQLQDILIRRIESLSREQEGTQWKSLSMTNELAAALVDPNQIEYIEWRDKTTGEIVMVFSGAGADVLEPGSPIMTKLMAQLKRCFSVSTGQSVGILGYDKASKQGVVQWCDGSSVCEECCRFALD